MLTINNNTLYKSPNFSGLNIGPKAQKALDKVGALQSPGQRLAFGVAALALHPIMDKMNPWVDDETKQTSAIRSVITMPHDISCDREVLMRGRYGRNT